MERRRGLLGAARLVARRRRSRPQSRIDVPRCGDKLDAGPDEDRRRRLGPAPRRRQGRGARRRRRRGRRRRWRTDVTDDSWRQWSIDWDATSGKHTLQVRATDKTGETQTEQVAVPPPTAPPATTRGASPSVDSCRADVDQDLADVGVGRHLGVGVGDRVERVAAVDHRAQRPVSNSGSISAAKRRVTATFSSIGRARSVVPTQGPAWPAAARR